ncbi:RHS repeat-associated core domain-containing protein [Nocardiopsis quinghaiensis]|uniref:RHS repeat-associated core domain-containing protein n=1 Tax=Nocardiopsis quinghaiensis TaxID=464995 RepID=UPI001CC26990|nr:RHS repeat-associated core domain-containing protein [Nocardiopsis quinghaiensis]
MSAATCTAASALVLGLLYAPPALADADPHSPADRTVPAPDTWEPGQAETEPAGGEPPEVPWTPPGAGGEAVPEAQDHAEDPEALMLSCGHGDDRGIQSWYPLERHQISDRMELAVNTHNGNLVVRHRDLTVAGTGLDLSVSSFYNSESLYGGWSLSHGQDVGLRIYSNGILFQGPSGYCEEFDIEEDGSFTPPPGLNAELDELSNGHYALPFHRGEYADQVWTFTADGRLYSQADRNGQTHRMNYDTNGDLVAIVDTQNRVTTFDWGDWGEGPNATVTGPTGETATSHTWNENGTSTLTDRAGQDIEFGYHESENGPGGRLLTSITDATGAVWELTYNDDGDVASLTVPDGTEDGATTSYSYGEGQTTVTDPEGGESTFTNDENNRRTSTTHPNGASEERTYDDSGRLTGTTTTGAAGQSLVEASYSYDNDGSDSDQLQSRTVNGDTETFAYDGLDRLTSDGTTDYTYDDVGNLLSAGEEEFSYNDADQVTTARGAEVGHDAAGNMTSRGEYVYEYSVTNQTLRSDDGDGELAMWLSYDTTDQTQMRGVTDVHEGDRIERQLSNTALGVTNIASEGERTSFVRDPEGRLVSMVAWDGNERFHYTTDHQNTVLALTAEGSEAEEPDVVYDYSPYGERTSESLEGTAAAGLSPFGYTGAYQFQDGTVHLNHRFHDTTTPNFTQPAPSRQELNNYAYAQRDPINNTNPSGLETYTECINKSVVNTMITGTVAGGAGGATAGDLGAVPGATIGAAGGLFGGVAADYIT